MNHRLTAIISTIASAFCDVALDVAINKYQIYFILFYTTVLSTFLQALYGLQIGIIFTPASIPFILLCGIFTLLGYFMYAKALTKLPVGLATMLEAGSLFIFLFVDILLGYIKVNFYFICLFLLFIFSVFIMTYDNLKVPHQLKNKTFQLTGFITIILSVLFYSLEPYFIKMASARGANEVAINLGYYFIAIMGFGFMYYRHHKDSHPPLKKSKLSVLILLIFSVSLFESLYYLFGTMSYISETPVIVAIIQQLRIFLMVLISAIIGTDKMTFRETLGLILGILAILGIYLY